MVKFFPERDYINRMKPPPTSGEKFLPDFLRRYLGNLNGDFEVFFRARLVEGFADFVVLRKNHGVLIIKVTDDDSNFITLINQAKSLKEYFCDACRIRGYRKISLPIQTAVFFHGATNEQIKKAFGFGVDSEVLLYNYVLLLTADGLERNGLQNLPKMNFLIGDRRSEPFTNEIYEEICRAVKPFGQVNFAEDLSSEQRKKLEPLLSGGSPNVKFFPELDELPHIRPFPTDGELYLLNFLKDYLGKQNGDFEVFFQAHWDGLKPDVIVMRKNYGILIIEVKDWNLDAYEFADDWTWTVKGTDSHLKSPLEQAKFYKDLFYDTYSRTLAEENLRNKKVYSLVRTAVFFYGATPEQVARIKKRDYISLLTCKELETNGLKGINYANYFFGDRASDFFSDDVYNELCRVLKPSEHSLSKIFFPAALSEKQRELAQSSRDYKRQIKGPAGSGKTTVLAFRAVDAFRSTNQPVLILTFNITLRNYIKDCINHALNSVSGLEGRKGYIRDNFFVISHFHEFIRGYRAKYNLPAIYDKDDNDTCELDNIPKQFRTIYVDETQDFERGWMETIVKLLEPGGELIFFGDKDQDLYQRRDIDHVPDVSGRPLELKGTYRLRTKIMDLARAFQKNFFGGSVGNEIDPQINLFDQTTVKYHYLQNFDKNAVMNICREVLNKESNDDICIMSHVVKYVRPIEKVLRDSGYKTLTTFETEEEYNLLSAQFDEETLKEELKKIRRPAKFAFNMESGMIKLSTIHSYKGWGVPHEILIIGNDAEDSDTFLNHEMIYTGITRAIKNLIVINIGDKEIDNFFKDWLKSHKMM